jgi:hypothetical protein
MDNDLVFYCSGGNTGISISWNEGKSNVAGVAGLQEKSLLRNPSK